MSNNEIKGGVEEEILDGGHIFRWQLPLDNLVTGKSCLSKQRFSSHCGAWSSFWELEITFLKEQDTDLVSCFHILKREDKKKLTLHAIINILFTYAKQMEYANVEIFHVDMLPGSEVRKSFADILPSLKGKYNNQEIIVHFEISVFRCHL